MPRWKMVDFACECGHLKEVLLDLNDEQPVVCDKCAAVMKPQMPAPMGAVW